MLTESGMVQNALDMVSGFLFVLADYLFKHTFCFFISDLFSSLLGLAVFPSLLFPFPVLFFCVFLLCLSFGCQSVPQLSKLGIICRRCSEFLDPRGSSLYHHICSEVYQCSVLRPDLYNIFINDLEEVMDSSSLQMTPDWGAPVDTLKGRAARQIDLDRLEERADRNLMKFDQDKCKALHLGKRKPFAVIQAGYCQVGESSVGRTRRTC